MPAKKAGQKKTEKKPLDMTSDEAIEFLFGQEGAQVLKDHVRKLNQPPDGDDNGAKRKGRSTRKQDTT
jgi:hypothetical protein